MRGYFGIGVEKISKPHNLGNLMRSAHAFGASFFFTLEAAFKPRQVRQADTSDAAQHLPLYVWDSLAQMQLPRGCQLVGVELTDEAVALPSFRHPQAAAYVLGPERGSLSTELQDRCDFLVEIPTKFCVNVGIAGALVMYDRALSMGRFAPRPAKPGAPAEVPGHVHGGPRLRRKRAG
ncbi:RNA methyltransferase [Leptolyngbya valderiana BDU 20041]|nr:RNA methyltransferase [Leptolyngbya valderiana BDU 20041]